jgi:hypothetical protein
MSLLSRLAVQAARAYGILSSKSTNISVTYLAVAGGGGGGGGHGGGGGAGGFKTSTTSLSTLNTYSIAVGAGGLGGINYSDPTSRGSSGSDSSISGTGLSTITSTGGGGGGGFATNSGIGASGGSGGGGAGQTTAAGGSGTSGQGNSGGSGVTSAYAGAGGGGGAGAAGGNGGGTVGGTGGAGTASSISGSSVTYAGGGGGGIGVSATGGTGGAGGGGNGSSNGGTTAGGNGTANTGGGGGGGGGDFPMNYRGGTGGSGIVIISYTSATPKFVGGTLTTSGGNQIHTFTSSGTLSPLTPVTASYLVVAGGGAGGQYFGGGGGGGGLLTGSTTLYSGATYVVTVGAGGAAAPNSSTLPTNASNSSLSGTGLTTITSIGGGYGAQGGASTTWSSTTGGSGGGGGSTSGQTGGSAGTSGQGNAGGTAIGATQPYTSGGGGGAGAVGSNATSTSGGAGGVGVSSSISGTSTYYAGGGGGNGGGTSAQYAGGAGGNGGGGTGGTANSATGVSTVSPISGTANTGGGGGGGTLSGTNNTGAGVAGGSGTVIISYAGSQVFNGGLVTSSGGNTIHTFNATGALTPLTNNLTNSLRFRSSASAYLSRTPTVAGNRRTYTFSAWVKRGSLGSAAQALLGAGISNTVYDRISFESDSIRIVFNNGTYDVNTSSVYRDPSAWYHVVVAMDTTQATAANRTKIYVNGNQITAFATASYPAQNHETNINNNIANSIGALYAGSWGTYFDGYMDDINFIDGQALEPYYFGNNDANGVWKPIKYTGMYGTNGFYLTFADTTSTTTLGYDSSGNNNNWTTNNISLTAGVTYDAMLDVPTNTSATVANYAVLNPLDKQSSADTRNANLEVSSTASDAQWKSIRSTLYANTGKAYFEGTLVTVGTTNWVVGLADETFAVGTSNNYVGSSSLSYGLIGIGTATYAYNNGSSTTLATGITQAAGDIFMVAIDYDAGKIWFGRNNAWYASGNPSTGANPTYTITANTRLTPALSAYSSASNSTFVALNCGQRPFSYTPPSGFVALNTFNLPTPTILQGNKYMDATLYTGTRTTQVVVNSGQFKPDMVWCKGRSFTSQILVADSVRGVTKQLFTPLTNAEQTDSTMISSFNNNGFTLGDGLGGPIGNINYEIGGTYVGWQWQAGQGSTSSNTSGSITSTVSVNTTAGFSVVTYTGTGANATVGHGLGVAPSMVIVKSRTTAENWMVYHTSIGATKYIYLDAAGLPVTLSTIWNNTAPTSSVFSIGTNATVNQSSTNYVAYSWAAIAGFSAFGSYTGNGVNGDGPFVYCGFRPKFVMFKNTATTQNWIIMDTSRDSNNKMTQWLFPNTSGAEYTDSNIVVDYVSNGFKIRTSTGTELNGNGNAIIFAAFAEHPFKNSNAR